MENIVTLYHGSSSIIERPKFGKGNPRNDYGLGFYCTESIELAREWASSDRAGGYANTYSLDASSLYVLNLSDGAYGILNWLAVLIDNRTFLIDNPIASEAKEYLAAWFLPDVSAFDAIVGYRADDSYFTFAQDFLNNTISVRQLGRAMLLGLLGKQFVLKSEKAFRLIEFVESEAVDGEVYYAKRRKRDMDARADYLDRERHTARIDSDIYMIDILRQGMRQGDARLQ
ncbi:MAG: DUF3990 domain-containing protein [Clostridiales bacterium]|nr:DUF3990 domain-containing protein [Clostridiales bacterium]